MSNREKVNGRFYHPKHNSYSQEKLFSVHEIDFAQKLSYY